MAHDGALNCIKMRNAHTLPTHTYSFPLGTASRPQKCSLIASTKRRHLFLVAAGERGQKSRKLGQGNCVDDVGFLNKWYFIYFYWQMSTRRRASSLPLFDSDGNLIGHFPPLSVYCHPEEIVLLKCFGLPLKINADLF